MGIPEWTAEVIVKPGTKDGWAERRNVFALGMENAVDCIRATYPRWQKVHIGTPHTTGYYLDLETGTVSR